MSEDQTELEGETPIPNTHLTREGVKRVMKKRAKKRSAAPQATITGWERAGGSLEPEPQKQSDQPQPPIAYTAAGEPIYLPEDPLERIHGPEGAKLVRGRGKR